MTEEIENLTKKLEEMDTSITAIKRTIDELNKNFADFLDIIIPLLDENEEPIAQEQMKLIAEKRKHDNLNCGGMFG